MTTPTPSNPNNKLEQHARRIEGRRLTQAFLDGEMSTPSPRLRELLASDPVLRQEWNDYESLGQLLAELPKSNDLSSSILSTLKDRPVFLPHEPAKRSKLPAISLGLAASLAIASGILWISTAGTKPDSQTQIAFVPAPTIAPSEATPSNPAPPDLLGDARETIWSTTGVPSEERDRRRNLLMTRATDGIIVPNAEELAPAHYASDFDARKAAGKMAGKSKVIERSGASVVNPGPQFASFTPASREAAMIFKAMPNAEYSGGRSRASDSYMVGGTYTLPGTPK